jgi:hypothetical protein
VAVVCAQRCGAPDGGDDAHGSAADDAAAVDPIKTSGASHRCESAAPSTVAENFAEQAFTDPSGRGGNTIQARLWNELLSERLRDFYCTDF